LESQTSQHSDITTGNNSQSGAFSSSPAVPSSSYHSSGQKRKPPDDLTRLLSKKRSKKSKATDLTSELEQYLHDDFRKSTGFLLPVTLSVTLLTSIDFGVEPENILTYWKTAETRWPTLAAVARDFLAIPAAGVGVERLFNVARDICDYRRHSLKPDTIRLLMMLTCAENLSMKEEYRLLLAATDLEDTATDDEDQEDHFDEEDRVTNLISDGEDHDDFSETEDDDPNEQSNAQSNGPDNHGVQRLTTVSPRQTPRTPQHREGQKTPRSTTSSPSPGSSPGSSPRPSLRPRGHGSASSVSRSQRQPEEASIPEDNMSLSSELPVLTEQRHVPAIGLTRRKYVLGQKAQSQGVNKGKRKRKRKGAGL